MTDVGALVCWRTADLPEARLTIKDSTRQACSRCGEEIWASPAGIAAVTKRHGVCRFLCHVCFYLLPPDDVQIAPRTPEQIAETLRWTRR